MSFIKKYKTFIILFIGILTVILYNYNDIFPIESVEATEYSEVLITSEYEEPDIEHIMVDIKGEVMYPGFYEVPDYLRIGDLINIAGGVTELGDLSEINLAGKIYDEMIIIIPSTIEGFENNTTDELIKVVVEIKGEVNNPGVYELYYNSRIIDIINLAGGLTDNADISGLNLANKIADEMVINIPEKAENVYINTDYIKKIVVEIKGEVNNPGVYEIEDNIRVSELIYLAGGLTDLADISEVNLADILEDCDVVKIPKINDIEDQYKEDIVKILVEIKGEVSKPGVYELYYNSRVNDLIKAAGGLTHLADISDISLVSILEDSDVIIIPIVPSLDSVSENQIVVEIKGEVFFPGLYSVDEGLRVINLINKAGGILDTADLADVDQAMILEDGMTITIPKSNDIDENEVRKIYVEIYGEVIHPGVYYVPETYNLIDLIYEAGGVTTSCDLTKINFDLTLCLGASIYIPSYDDELVIVENNSLININTANLDTLMTLTGIGQILGQRIIDYRSENGYFLSIEDIMNVSGIKDSIYEQIKESITV